MPRVTDWSGITRTPTGYFVKVEVRPLPAKGKRFKDGTPLRTMQQWRDETRDDLQRLRDRMAPAEGAETLEQAVTRYLGQWGTGKHPVTVSERARHLHRWAGHFAGRPRHSITAAEIEAALAAWQRDDGTGAAIWNKRRLAIRMLFRVLDRGRMLPNPVDEVPAAKEPAPQARGLPMPVVRELVAAVARPEYQARLGVMAFTGLRPEEVMRIVPGDVDLPGGRLFVRSAKFSPQATVPLLPEAVTWLTRFDALGAYGRFNLNRLGEAMRQAHAHVNGGRAARGLPALPPVRPYDLRHSFGTELYRVTKDLKTVKEGMRHALITTSERYVQGSVSLVLEQGITAMATALADTQTDTQVDTHRGAPQGRQGGQRGQQRATGIPAQMPFPARVRRKARV